MKMPVNCPICNDIMLTIYLCDTVMEKICKKRLSHKLTYYSSYDAEDTVKFISLERVGKGEWSWDMRDKILCLLNNYRGGSTLPYFEPDFSNFEKLRNKLKTYLIFS